MKKKATVKEKEKKLYTKVILYLISLFSFFREVENKVRF